MAIPNELWTEAVTQLVSEASTKKELASVEISILVEVTENSLGGFIDGLKNGLRDIAKNRRDFAKEARFLAAYPKLAAKVTSKRSREEDLALEVGKGILVDIGISDELAGKITDFLWGEVVKGE